MQKTPNLNPQIMFIHPGYVNKLLGTEFGKEEIKRLLGRMRYGVADDHDNDTIGVLVPAYRTDILHSIDLVEDIAISYGYENFNTESLSMVGIGKKDSLEKFSDAIRELMLGFGLQEVMGLSLTNRKNLFERMDLKPDGVVETENPVSREHGVLRTWMIPSLMTALKNNQNREYPQHIFEIGDCVSDDGKNIRKLAFAIADSKANFSELKSYILGLFNSIGICYGVKKLGHASFIKGRCAAIIVEKEIGFFGEIHPHVLENFDLEIPVTSAEINLSALMESSTEIRK